MKLAHHVLLVGLCSAASLAMAHGRAHEHGVMHVDIAIEARGVTVVLRSPLDNLVGFERAPRTDAERQRVDAALARIRSEDGLFTIDPAARCRFDAVQVESPVLGLGAAPSAANDAHAELQATLAFGCLDSHRAEFIDAALFQAFAGLKRVEVQVAGPRGQSRHTLRRPAGRIVWRR